MNVVPKLEYEFKLRDRDLKRLQAAFSTVGEEIARPRFVGQVERRHVYFDRSGRLHSNGFRLRGRLKSRWNSRPFTLKQDREPSGKLRCSLEYRWSSQRGYLDLADPVERRMVLHRQILAVCFDEHERQDRRALREFRPVALVECRRRAFEVPDSLGNPYLFDLMMDEVTVHSLRPNPGLQRAVTFGELEVEVGVETSEAMKAAEYLAELFEAQGFAICHKSKHDTDFNLDRTGRQ